MNETIKTIMERRSLRVYADKPVSGEEKDHIIRCAMRAPTAGNMMLYSILEVADQEKKNQLVVTCDNQPFIAKAPLVLVFLADMQRWHDYYVYSDVKELCQRKGLEFESPAEADLMLASCDALIAAQTAALGAESMGIGSCYIGDIMENYEVHRDMFDLPPLVFPVTMLCFGHYRKDKKQPARTPRFPENAIHFTDCYQRLDAKNLEQVYAKRFSKQFVNENFLNNAENVGQHFYLKKTGSDFLKKCADQSG